MLARQRVPCLAQTADSGHTVRPAELMVPCGRRRARQLARPALACAVACLLAGLPRGASAQDGILGEAASAAFSAAGLKYIWCGTRSPGGVRSQRASATRSRQLRQP